MEWFGAFALGLSNAFFWPFIGLTILCGAALFWADDQKQRNQYGSAEYSTAGHVQHGALQGVVIMWLLWGIVSAVPEPNFIEKVKQVEVVKEVKVTENFTEALSNCIYEIDNRVGDEQMSDKAIFDYCNTKVSNLIQGKPQIVEKIVEKPVLMPKEQRYRTLYNTCMGGDLDVTNEGVKGWSAGSNQERDKRIAQCHAQVKEIVGA